MINAREAKERVKAHRSCVSLRLVSRDKNINARCVRDIIGEAIRQVASDGLSSVDIVLSSIEPLNEILDFDDISFSLMASGYIVKWSEETIGKAEGIVGEHFMSLGIGW